MFSKTFKTRYIWKNVPLMLLQPCHNVLRTFPVSLSISCIEHIGIIITHWSSQVKDKWPVLLVFNRRVMSHSLHIKWPSHQPLYWVCVAGVVCQPAGGISWQSVCFFRGPRRSRYFPSETLLWMCYWVAQSGPYFFIFHPFFPANTHWTINESSVTDLPRFGSVRVGEGRRGDARQREQSLGL